MEISSKIIKEQSLSEIINLSDFTECYPVEVRITTKPYQIYTIDIKNREDWNVGYTFKPENDDFIESKLKDFCIFLNGEFPEVELKIDTITLEKLRKQLDSVKTKHTCNLSFIDNGMPHEVREQKVRELDSSTERLFVRTRDHDGSEAKAFDSKIRSERAYFEKHENNSVEEDAVIGDKAPTVIKAEKVKVKASCISKSTVSLATGQMVLHLKTGQVGKITSINAIEMTEDYGEIGENPVIFVNGVEDVTVELSQYHIQKEGKNNLGKCTHWKFGEFTLINFKD